MWDASYIHAAEYEQKRRHSAMHRRGGSHTRVKTTSGSFCAGLRAVTQYWSQGSMYLSKCIKRTALASRSAILSCCLLPHALFLSQPLSQSSMMRLSMPRVRLLGRALPYDIAQSMRDSTRHGRAREFNIVLFPWYSALCVQFRYGVVAIDVSRCRSDIGLTSRWVKITAGTNLERPWSAKYAVRTTRSIRRKTPRSDSSRRQSRGARAFFTIVPWAHLRGGNASLLIQCARARSGQVLHEVWAGERTHVSFSTAIVRFPENNFRRRSLPARALVEHADLFYNGIHGAIPFARGVSSLLGRNSYELWRHDFQLHGMRGLTLRQVLRYGLDREDTGDI
ncbi:hypothetical protein C8R47DRAFT_1082971 [Mycena vitilis]|nr:hypothetical protein C8R47DRAFT_1082971 [Mycena vitilis]